MRKQQPIVDRSKARGWVAEKGIRLVSIQKALDMKSLTQASETLSGIRHDRRVLCYLLNLGCPDSYLKFPENMKVDTCNQQHY